MTVEQGERKSIAFRWKEDGPEGSFLAIFSSFDTIDSYGDVAKQGAFPDGKEVLVGAFGHASPYGALPVGKGIIRSDESLTYIDGQFNLKMTAGRETYEAVKDAGPLLEWSYIYMPVKYSFGELDGKRVRFLEEVDVWSVDPVLKGAGQITGTVSIKGAQAPITEHFGAARAAVAGAVERAKALAALRAQDGREISAATLEEVKTLRAALEAANGDLRELIEGKSKDNTGDWMREIARVEAGRASAF